MDKQTLKQYQSIKREIERLQTEKDRMAQCYVGAVKITGMPSGKGIPGDPVGKAAVKLVALSQELADRLNELIALRRSIEIAIGSLPPLSQEVMRLRYIEDMAIKDIAKTMSYSEEWVFKTHEKSLKTLKVYQ